jgi:hypothetical protein
MKSGWNVHGSNILEPYITLSSNYEYLAVSEIKTWDILLLPLIREIYIKLPKVCMWYFHDAFCAIMKTWLHYFQFCFLYTTKVCITEIMDITHDTPCS